MSAAVALRHVRVRRNATPVVHDITLEVAQGSWFGLIGANGSGKTSLLRAIGGRLDIDSGQCAIAGVELAENRQARAERIGFAPTVDALPEALTARELLNIAARGDADWPRSVGIVGDALKLDALLDLPVGECSAGMRQRIALACAFAGGRDLIILDEPFNWLDPVAAYDLRGALRVRVKAGLTLITALHDMTTLASACDAGALMGGGHIVLHLGQSEIDIGKRDPGGFEHRLIHVLRTHQFDGGDKYEGSVHREQAAE